MIDDRSVTAGPGAPAWMPDPRLVRRAAMRGALLWVGLRVGIGVVLLSLGGDPVRLEPAAALALVAPVAAGVALETRRAGETLFAANLGQNPAWWPGVAAAVAAVLEVCVALAV